jgi:ankyrin repeat protein
MRRSVICLALGGLLVCGCQPERLEIRSSSPSERELMKGGRELVRAIMDGDDEKAKKLAHLYWVPVLPEANMIPIGDKCCFPIHAAAGAGRVEVVKALIAAGADVNARDNWGFTPIIWAVSRCVPDKMTLEESNAARIECIRELVKAGADVNAGTRKRWTALHGVALCNPETLPFVRELVRLGADVNRVNDAGETALHVWCRNANLVDKPKQGQFREAVRHVLEHGADVRIKDKEGRYAEDWLKEEIAYQKEVIGMIREARRKQEAAKKVD